MTHIADEQIAAYALDDVEDGTRAAIDAHLETCAACRAALAETRTVLDVAGDLPVPERDEDYGADVWRRIEPQLPQRPGVVLRRSWNWQPWLAAAAVLLVAVGAYLAGRFSREVVPDGPVNGATLAARVAPETIRERVVLAALGEHLDRTERTLVEFVNADGEGRVDISAEQAWARDLLDANRLYRQAARGTGAPALSQVLDDLEPILVEIANSPSRLTSDEFKTLRTRIEERSLVFKVRVTGAELRARQRSLIPGDKQS